MNDTRACEVNTFSKILWLIIFFAGTLVMIFVMMRSGATLKTSATPRGIIDLEFAYDTEKASAVMYAWQNNNHVDNVYKAKINTYLDFVFLFFYSFFLYYSCKIITPSFKGFLFKSGRFLTFGAIAAGVFDVIENVGMLITLHNYRSNIIATITFIFSIAKWVLVSATVIYILTGACILLWRHLGKRWANFSQ